MLRVEVNGLQPGMIVAKEVLLGETRLAPAGTPIRPGYRERLAQRGVTELWVVDPRGTEPEAVSYDSRQGAFVKVRDGVLAWMQRLLHEVRLGQASGLGDARHVMAPMVDEVLCGGVACAHVSDLELFDDYTYEHSVQVAVLSLLLGVRLGMSRDELLDLGIGALLHDTGKAWLPLGLLNKPSRYTETEFQQMTYHVSHGEKILKNVEGLPPSVARVAMEHHEWVDGHGYRKGLKGTQTHTHSRIVAVCDVYDAMTSDRPYRKRLLPHQAMEFLTAKAGAQFDPEIAEIFVRQVAVVSKGSLVVLNNGRLGRVVSSEAQGASTPVVALFCSEHGEDGGLVELSAETGLAVAKVIVPCAW